MENVPFSREATHRVSPSAVKKAVLVIALTILGLILISRTSHAQPAPGDMDDTIDGAIRAEIIDSVIARLDEYYVFPDVANDMGKLLRKNLKKKHYDTVSSGLAFTQALTDDMRSISHDGHLWVRYDPEIAIRFAETDTVTEEMLAADRERERRDNYGFYKAERLRGNIGYLDFRGFSDAKYGGATAIAALNFLANVDALIIDMRRNGGGSPSMIQLITSYFFNESMHLNSFYVRKLDTIQQFWTQEFVQGPRMSDVDLYVLTSDYTFSAAEEFTYNLKNMERATIIGDTTGGGAHPNNRVVFPKLNTMMSVPYGRAINPITGTNWEGVGVIPDIAVPQEQALDVAKLEALKKLKEKATDEERKQVLAWDIQSLESVINPVTVDPAILQKYVGVYGPRTIIFEDGELYYQRVDRPKYKLIPMADDLFRIDEIGYFRLKVVLDDQGQPIELIGLYDNGREDRSPRTGS